MRIKKIIRKGIVKLKHANSPVKEIRRFKDIYGTVYTHATKKGQSSKQALNYCWNVYSEQAPAREKQIIKIMIGDKNMLGRSRLREMILKEMYMPEGDVVQMSDYASPREPVVEEGTPFEMFLSKIHTEMMDFMDENFESISSDESTFLDELLDSIEDVLGIVEEEGIDVPGDDEDFDEIEDED